MQAFQAIWYIYLSGKMVVDRYRYLNRLANTNPPEVEATYDKTSQNNDSRQHIENKSKIKSLYAKIKISKVCRLRQDEEPFIKK